MRRIRIVRILLLLVLVLLAALVVVSFRDRPAALRVVGQSTNDGEKVAEGIDYIHFKGDETSLDLEAGEVRQLEDGSYRALDVQRLGIPREGAGPLLVRAQRADVRGPDGERTMDIREEVVIRDPEAGLTVTLPQLDVDEVAGVARSVGEIRFEGPASRGRASQLVYGLDGQPSTLEQPVFEDFSGARIEAARAILHDGLEDVELDGGVNGDRGAEWFRATRLRLRRDDLGRLRRAEATENVAALIENAAGARLEITAGTLDAEWAADGNLLRSRLDEDASVRLGNDLLSARLIEGERLLGANDGWRVTASGDVYLLGRSAEGPAWLRAERLDATLDAALAVREAEALGRVRFESAATLAESDRGRYDPTRAGREILLTSTGARKTRMSRDRTRVAADEIALDRAGGRIHATGHVDATLLPGTNGATPAGLFRTEEAVHFVAHQLEGERRGGQLVFSGAVRAWQGERNLSAERVIVDQLARTLVAEGKVTTRIPRLAGRAAAAEADYIQVSADRLEYDERTRRGVFTGGVRATVVEGRLECERLELLLADGGAGMREAWAFEDVRVEFRRTEPGAAPEIVSGTADRLSYLPAEATVRLYGDRRPAAVRRHGARDATTSGRVLRYQLDVGTLEVESADSAPARIRGS